ncbi:MAG: tRNA lysidine(34) synthetase TilS [Verrucomicrobiia bacterium]
MKGLAEQIERVIAEHRLLDGGARVLVAVSGGLDSMVLLSILALLAPKHGWDLVVAHFNHQLRGESSDADEAFVREAATKLNLPFRAGRGNVKLGAARRRLSIEMAARQLRHRFLAKTAVTLGIRKVALAHHANDQLELFFLRLIRGAGPEGLSGMDLIAPSPADPGVQLIRPLLEIRRSDLEQFARDYAISFRHDASNDAVDYERNRVRHELLPFLRERFGRRLEASVPRLMDVLRAESDFVAQQAKEILSDQLDRFERLPIAIQRRKLRLECLRLGIAADFDLIESLRQTPDVPRMIGPRWTVHRDASGNVRRRSAAKRRFESSHETVDLNAPAGSFEFGRLTLSWHIEPWTGWPKIGAQPTPGLERFDAEAVGTPIRLRHWRPGDRFHPAGMKAPVKVQNLFVNLKIPQARRRSLVVAESARGDVFWIEELRISEPFKIREGTRRCLVWSWKPSGR